MDPPGNSPVGSAKKRKRIEIASEIEIDSPPWVPKGWRTYERVRQSGITAGTKDKYYFDPHTGHRFRSMPEVIAYKETGQIPKPKPKPKRLQSGNNEFEAVTLHSEFQAITLESAQPKNNDSTFNQDGERDKEQHQPFHPHLKNVKTIEFLKADDFKCRMKRSNDDFGRKRFLLDLDLNKIPDDTNFPFHCALDAEDQNFSLQNSLNVGVTDGVFVGANERISPPLLKSDVVSNSFLGFATPKPEATSLPIHDQGNVHWLAQPMQNMNIKTKSLLNTGSSYAVPDQRKMISIHDPASPCSVLRVEKQSDKHKRTASMKRINNNRRKRTGDFSKVTGKEFKRYLAELGRKLCINVSQRNQSAVDNLGPLMSSKP